MIHPLINPITVLIPTRVDLGKFDELLKVVYVRRITGVIRMISPNVINPLMI
jgi:hypothetical protein